jgi:putative salt-induced outer membrane protein YdiY
MKTRTFAYVVAAVWIVLLRCPLAGADDADQIPLVIDDSPAIIDALERAAAPAGNPFVQQAPVADDALPAVIPESHLEAILDSQREPIAERPLEAIVEPPLEATVPPQPDAIPEPVFEALPGEPVDADLLVPENPSSYSDEYADGYWDDLGSYVPSWVHQWEGSFDFGLTGSAGNSRNTNIGLGLHAKKVSGLDTLSVDMDYYFNQDDVGVTKNRFYGLGRYERAFDCSPFSWYFDLWYEYDQFTAFRSRIGFHTGLGVSLLEWDNGFLRARAGLGASRPMSGVDAVWSPEVQAGLDYERQLTKRQKLFAHLDYYPDINDFGTFRLHARAGWELLIHEPSDLSLKLTAFDRYRTTTDPGFQANDLDYLLAISWGF